MTTTVRTIFSINATARSHDFLVIRRGPAGISIEAQSREDEWESATAGPFTPEQLRAALDEVAPAGSYTRTDEGAHIGPEGETDWHGLYLSENRRAEKAERERGELRDAWEGAVESVKEANSLINSLRAAESRPFAPDAITDEMVERGKLAFYQTAEGDLSLDVRVRRSLTAALTEPLARPEGAEKLAEVIDGLFTGDEGIYADDLADSLARCGVRVVTEEQQ